MHWHITDAYGGDMRLKVRVLEGIGLDKAQAVAEKLYVIRLAGEQEPTRSGA
jgi:hypothetical protein